MTALAHITSHEHSGRVRHVQVRGDIDLANVGEVRQAITSALADDPTRVILDLRGTTYLDSAAIAMLFRLAQRLGHRRQDLALVVPPRSPIRAVLELTSLQTVIRLHDTLEEASGGPTSANPTGAGGA
ncbi:STAS domain-containing protein [Intrasporangium calvum]|uniref:Anti-sigma factor antagonist n=1 Tax=Intrasporangium calvum TaxID=53358 RepID=A0ABT5GG11_9MICO|nr:STAS domain-containing protein [Intrasporangium calvum]MDC5696851.1 STAS domain-containing protein [Intrasporangium calvum]